MTAKKTAVKKATPKKLAKKAAKKVTAKKATKKATKKTAKKASKQSAKKTAPKTVNTVAPAEQELSPQAKPAASYEELREAAYLNYLDRVQNGYPGSSEVDWAKAEIDLS